MTVNKDRKMAELGALIKLKLAQKHYDEAEKLSVELLEIAESGSANNQLVGLHTSTEPADAVLGAIALSAADEQAVRDREHLRLLSIFHYIFGAGTAAVSCMFLFHIGMGLFMLNPHGIFYSSSPVAPPPEVAYMFIAIGSICLFFGWLIGLLNLYSGRCIHARKHWVFSFIVAALCCLSFPLGTILGVCSIITLNRYSIKALYKGSH